MTYNCKEHFILSALKKIYISGIDSEMTFSQTYKIYIRLIRLDNQTLDKKLDTRYWIKREFYLKNTPPIFSMETHYLKTLGSI